MKYDVPDCPVVTEISKLSSWIATVAISIVLGTFAPSFAQAPAPGGNTGAIRGLVTALNGEVALPGATLQLDAVGASVVAATLDTVVSDERGRFQFAGVPAGRYRLTASLDGFANTLREIVVERGKDADVTLDLQVAGVTESVTVKPQVQLELGATLGSAGVVDFAQLQTTPVGDVSIESVLPLVPGVIHGPSGVSIKGGRPTQAGVQLGPVDLTDASTGEAEFKLPSNAVGSLEVLPSPYAVEYGRFSAGLTAIQPKKGGETWRFTLAAINPAFRTKRGSPATILGIETFAPRAWVGGPLIKDRLFLAQSLQYRYASAEIRSRPQSDRTRTESGSSFTRLDAKLTDDQRVWTTIGVFPESKRFATLGTFDPPESTASTKRYVYDVALGAESSFGQTSLLESTVHAKRHDVRAFARGTDTMVFGPYERSGHFFNDQDRDTWSVQWRESVSTIKQHAAGTHFLKTGIDLVWSSFEGTSVSRPIEITTSEGRIVRRITFEDAVRAEAAATDVALFVQDRWQPINRVLVDAGLRWDRDGVLDAGEWSPRLGVRVTLDSQERMTLGAGVGRFVERTPLTLADAEAWLGARTVTDFYPTADISSIPGTATRYVPRLMRDNLQAPAALTWHAEYAFRLSPVWSIRADVLTRRTRHEYVVLPEITTDGAWLTIDSQGTSRYREVTLSTRYAPGTYFSADVSYVRSNGRADLNSYAAFLGSIRQPIIRENAYGRTEADVPNRVVAQLRGEIGPWRMASVFEYRDGLPYSAFDVRQDYVGEPNDAGRLRSVVSLDVTAERRVRIGKVKPWVGLQLLNALGRFNPRDAQQNLAATTFGTFYNSEPRRLRITLRF